MWQSLEKRKYKFLFTIPAGELIYIWIPPFMQKEVLGSPAHL